MPWQSHDGASLEGELQKTFRAGNVQNVAEKWVTDKGQSPTVS